MRVHSHLAVHTIHSLLTLNEDLAIEHLILEHIAGSYALYDEHRMLRIGDVHPTPFCKGHSIGNHIVYIICQGHLSIHLSDSRHRISSICCQPEGQQQSASQLSDFHCLYCLIIS